MGCIEWPHIGLPFNSGFQVWLGWLSVREKLQKWTVPVRSSIKYQPCERRTPVLVAVKDLLWRHCLQCWLTVYLSHPCVSCCMQVDGQDLSSRTKPDAGAFSDGPGTQRSAKASDEGTGSRRPPISPVRGNLSRRHLGVDSRDGASLPSPPTTPKATSADGADLFSERYDESLPFQVRLVAAVKYLASQPSKPKALRAKGGRSVQPWPAAAAARQQLYEVSACQAHCCVMHSIHPFALCRGLIALSSSCYHALIGAAVNVMLGTAVGALTIQSNAALW